MRNLKKVLALALAVVMLVGVMAMGAGAATYADTYDSDYSTAIEVVSAIEAITGSNGDFRPDGRLTRADGAVIAARVALTRGIASKLVGASGVYSDVSAKHYASGAIAWATNEGYLSGDGSGAFNPNGSLYGIHFAKMLLGVLGYDAAVEGFTGKDYVQKILVVGTLAGLFEGLEDVEMNGRITRGQAAQMAYNALMADTVAYTGGTSVTIGETTIVTGSVRNKVEQATTATNWDATAPSDNDGIIQLCEKLYPTLKADKAGSDNFGRPGTAWTYKGEDVAVDVAAPVFTATAFMDTENGVKAIYKALKGFKVSDVDFAETDAETIAATTGNGILVEVFADEDKNLTWTAVDCTIGEVTKVIEATETNDRAIKIELADGSLKTYETEGYDVEDMLLVYIDNNSDVAAVEPAAKITDTMTVNKTFVVGGRNVGFQFNDQKFEMHETIVTALTDGDVGYDFNVWFDAYGYVIAVTPVEEEGAAPNYAYVVKTTLDAGTLNNEDYVTLIFADGTMDTVRTTELNGADANTGKWDGTSAETNKHDGKLVTWTWNLAGTARVLTPVVTVADAEGKIEISKGEDEIKDDGVALTQVLTGRSPVLMLTWNRYHTEIVDAKLVNGFANVDNILLAAAEAGDLVYTYDDDNSDDADEDATSKENDILFAIVDVTNNSYGYKPTTAEWVYILSTATKVVELQANGAVVTYYTYEALQGGVETVIKSSVSTYAEGEFYAVVTSSNGYLTLATSDANAGIATSTATGVVAVVNNVIGVGSNYYALAEEPVAYYIDLDGDMHEVAVNKLKTDANDEVEFVTVTDATTQISILTHIFVTEVENP